MNLCSPIRLVAVVLALLLLAIPGLTAAQFGDQRYMLTNAERQELSAGRDRLRRSVDELREQAAKSGKPKAEQLPDVEIFLDAVDRNLAQDLFFSKGNAEQARACLKEGEERAAALREGRTPWERQKGVVVLGHRSEVDGTAQPYQVYLPESYDFAGPKPLRLEIFLHGRAATMNEIAFIGGRNWVRSSFGVEELPYLALYPYGRANNAWRYAGERDMFEALADLKRRYSVDANRIMLRGFSMGGQGTWHIGLQHPGDWAAMSPGAGFVDTINYKQLKDPFPAWQRSLLHLYDAVDYATNAVNLPVLPYIGDQDPALGQHRLMYETLRKEGAPFVEFLGPQTPHRYHPEVLQEILKVLATKERRPDALVNFVTYTLRWPECKWVRLEGLQRHWERALVKALPLEGEMHVDTKNVSALQLTVTRTASSMTGGMLTIDGQTFRFPEGLKKGRRIGLTREGSKWALKAPTGLRKKPGLQGPIDDALFGPVLAVSGTGTPWSAPMDGWLRQELQRFRDGFSKYFRGRLPERTDRELTDAEIRGHNLYLFGDPGSNAVLRRVLPKLPLKWTKETVEIAGREFPTGEHLPMLVFPNPENPERYVVLNSAMTFSRADWNASNAFQYPHLPDYAIIRYNAAAFSDNRAQDTVLAGFFDERWRVAEAK